MRYAAIALPLALPLIAGAATPAPGTLIVEVGNVRSDKGTVHVDICRETQFLKDDCAWSGNARAQTGTTRVVITNLPAGRYAAQVFQDENGNKQVDRGMFGIPKEGVGFSNDAKIRFGPPKFAEAAFGYDGAGGTIRLNMRYMLGASGPAKR